MNTTKLINLSTWIEANSLKSFLAEEGIECHIPEKHISGSVLGEPEIRFGGLSAINPGVDVYVKNEDLERAKTELIQWNQHLRKMEQENPTSSEIPIENYFKYFSTASFFSLVFPILLLLLATWYLVKLIFGKPRHYPKTFWISLILYFISLSLHFYVGYDYLKEFI
jgi:hypothetical protein